ncbi:MAG TPA: hypothetical protein VFE42_29960 [Chloroflexota bacterium]|nr:hypothetical protein [Chloroflexota bacterium]
MAGRAAAPLRVLLFINAEQAAPVALNRAPTLRTVRRVSSNLLDGDDGHLRPVYAEAATTSNRFDNSI